MTDIKIFKVIEERDLVEGRKLQWIITEQPDGRMFHQFGIDSGKEEWDETLILDITDSHIARNLWKSYMKIIDIFTTEGDEIDADK